MGGKVFKAIIYTIKVLESTSNVSLINFLLLISFSWLVVDIAFVAIYDFYLSLSVNFLKLIFA